MKRIGKYLLYSLAGLILLIILLPMSLYVPSIQHGVSRYIEQWFDKNTDMNLSVGYLSLHFPFDLAIDDIMISKAENDTLFHVQQAKVQVALKPLIHGNIDISQLSLQQAFIHFVTPDSTLNLQVKTDHLALGIGQIALSSRNIGIEEIKLDNSNIVLHYVSTPDTSSQAGDPIDWDIAINNINIDNLAYTMFMPHLIDTLQVSIENASIIQGDIQLKSQNVAIGQVAINKGNYRYVARNQFVSNNIESNKSVSDSTTSLPWQVAVGQILLSNNQAQYITGYGQPTDGIDFSHIAADNINIELQELYNRGSRLNTTIKNLSLNERSGLCITHTEGIFEMTDSGDVALNNFVLRTPFSEINADINTHLNLLDWNPDAPLNVKAKSSLSCNDICRIYPDADSYFIHPESQTFFSGYDNINATIDINGNGRKLLLNELSIIQPGIFTLKGKGLAQQVLNPHKRVIEATCDINTTQHITLARYIPDSLLRKRIALQPLHLSINASLQEENINAQAALDGYKGQIDLNAQYNLQSEKYDATIAIKQLQLDQILPHDTLGNLTAKATLAGEHLSIQNPALKLQAAIEIDTLEFQRYTYSDIDLAATIEQRHWNFTAQSTQPEIDFNIDASGIFEKDLLTADVNAHIDKFDIWGINFASDHLDMQGDITASIVASNIDSIVQADILLNDLIVGIGNYRYNARQLNLLAASDITYSYIDLSTGDLNANLSSDAGLTHLRPSIERLLQFVDTVVYKQRLNMDELHQGLPPFIFTANAGRDNIAQQYLNSMGIKFSSMQFGASNDSVFGMSGKIHQLNLSQTQLDTITLNAHEINEKLNYRIELNNRPGNFDELAHAHIEGFLSGNSTRLYIMQNNRKGNIGITLGGKIDFIDSLIHITLGPKEPIIGYQKWLLNRDNYITYNHIKRSIDANVKLSYDDSHLYITTEDRRNKSIEGMHINLYNIEIADWIIASPLVTPMKGNLSTNIYVDIPPKGIELAGTVDILDYTYANKRVGSFHAVADYHLDSIGGNDVNATLSLDNNKILTLKGYVGNDKPSSIWGTLSIDKLPLASADAFFPSNMGEFSGHLNCNLSIKGTTQKPIIDGFIKLNDATTLFSNIGASLTFDNTEIPISNSSIYFNKYGIRGANNNPLNISGTVNLSNLSHIGVNLDINGKNFEPIHIGESRTSIIYGSVFTDVGARLKGTLNNLLVQGRISLLAGTNATYVMQSNAMQSSRDYTDMVTFVSFADTIDTFRTINDEKALVSGSTMNAAIDITIDPGVQLGVNLSTDGKNRIDLIGGGNLLYTMNALGDSRISGRYTLSGGFVRYTPPIIAQKLFNIQEGSFVSWNGNIADPSFNIKAVQTQRASVKDGEDNSRLVNFDITILITNTLKDLGISFDLATTEDLAIENELQSMAPEQRSTKALNMLLYNSYDNLSSGNANNLIGNPLNTFLEYELNSWAQKTLKGVDLSFGIDNYGDESLGTLRTDYSYRFSKSLFDNRLKVVVGGSYTTDQDATQNITENLIDDISLEYRLTKRDNMYLKIFRQTGYESIIEGEITQTGIGFLYRKQVMSLLDLFRKKTNENLSIHETSEHDHHTHKNNSTTPIDIPTDGITIQNNQPTTRKEVAP